MNVDARSVSPAVIFRGDDLTGVNNDRADASNAQMLSFSAISKCLK